MSPPSSDEHADRDQLADRGVFAGRRLRTLPGVPVGAAEPRQPGQRHRRGREREYDEGACSTSHTTSPASDTQATTQAAELEEDDSLTSSLERIQERDAERVVLDDLDALFIRNDSIDHLQERPGATPLAVVFGQMLQDRGVTVVNDPSYLTGATSKLYLEEFPVKPLYGSKGRNVFLVDEEGTTNLA